MKHLVGVNKKYLNLALKKSALACAVSIMLAGPLLASADNLYKCMADEGQIYYQDIKCSQAQESIAILSANGKTGPVKVSLRKEADGVALAPPKTAQELSVNQAKNSQAQPKS
jgi:hypothetical protein